MISDQNILLLCVNSTLYDKIAIYMKKALSSLVLAATMATAAQAQEFSIAPEVGVNINTMHQTFGGIQRTTSFQPGFRVGAVVEYQFNDHVAIASGLRFDVNHGTSSSGERNYATGSGIPNYETDERQYNLVYANVPLYFVFKTNNFYEDPHFIFGIGPSANFLIGGQYKQEFSSGANQNARITRREHNINIGNVRGKDNIRMFDVSADAFVGYHTGKNLYLKATYAVGLLNLAPAGDADNTMCNMSIGISAGWTFGLSKKNNW